MDSMIEDYNEGFVSDEKKEVAYTIDNVAAHEMLQPYYAVSYLTTLNLTAPSGAAQYYWSVTVVEDYLNSPKGTDVTPAGSTNINFNCYLLKSNIKRWGTYDLTLIVTKTNGETMTDSAKLYVY